jgi:hypothetical protein
MVRQMKGEHLFKMDAHSVLMPGWDMPLRDLTGEDIFATTRMYSLDETTWTMGTRRLDFCYISNQIKTEWWTNYGQRVPNEEVSETMSFYGTTWFTSKKLWDAIGGYDTRAGAWGDSGVEFSAKAWLTGRRVLVHRGVWCAHLYRKKFPYCMSGHEHRNTVRVIRGMIREGKISGQIHGLEWLVGRFWPVPTWGNTMEESHER